jgi:hypothetical protein
MACLTKILFGIMFGYDIVMFKCQRDGAMFHQFVAYYYLDQN